MEIFLILTGFTMAGATFAVALLWYVKCRRRTEQIGSTPSGPMPVPSYEEVVEPAAATRPTFDSKRDPDKGSVWNLHAE